MHWEQDRGRLDGHVIRRSVARVLLFDERGRLLLLRGRADDGIAYWYPAGGRIEPGEAPREAARRELLEELGVGDAEIGAVALRRRTRFVEGGRRFDQDEWHFVGRVPHPVISASRPGDNETAAVAAHRWWSLTEIRGSADRFFPEGIDAVVERLLAHRSHRSNDTGRPVKSP